MALRRRAPDVPDDFFPGFADVIEIGSGALSTTYRARETASGQWRALKLLTVDDVSPGALEQFEYDVTALRTLSEHPNIVSVYGSLRARDGRPVLVLEQCRTSVADLMAGAGGLPVRDVVSLGVKIAGGLETAHRAGMVHRSVTPRDVLVTDAGQPALDDFGLAMLRPAADVTVARSLAATRHQAPEQFASAEVSPATDIYGLASALYELISGRSPFGADGHELPAAVMQRIMRDPVPPLSPRQAPPRLSDLLVGSMSKDQRARPGTAVEFARELNAVEADLRWPVTDLIVRDVPPPRRVPPAAPGVQMSPPSPTPRPSPRPTPSVSGRTSGWTPPPAEDWFPASPPAPAAAPPSLPSTDWSEPTRSAPRHARPDGDENDHVAAGAALVDGKIASPAGHDPHDQSVDDPAAALWRDAPMTSPGLGAAPPAPADPPADELLDADGLTAAQYAELEAAAAQAPPTTLNPIPPQSSRGGDDWSHASLSESRLPSGTDQPPPQTGAVPVALDPPEPVADPTTVTNRGSAGQPEAAFDPTLGVVDVGATTSQPAWRQARAAAAAAAAADPVASAHATASADAAATEAAVAGPDSAAGAEEIDLNNTIARYPIPPSVGEGDQPTGGVPAWAYREPEPEQATPGAAFGSDLTLDPMSLRRRVTIRSGGHALIVDAERLVLRAWLRRTELAWADVLGFEPRFDGVGASGSGGQLVAITRNGPLDLPATKTSMADLRYVQALLNAYWHRAQMSVQG